MKYKEFFHNVPEAIFVVDPSMRITYVSGAFELITGIKKRKIIGNYCKDILKSDSCDKHCELKKVMKSGSKSFYNIEYISPEGGRLSPVSFNVAPVKDKGGKVIYGIASFRLINDQENLDDYINEKSVFEGIVSKNQRMHSIFKDIKSYAKSDQNVLILGKTGTGKNLVAKAIHKLGNRSEKPLSIIEINTIPDTLIESELFGHKKGSFTGAHTDRIGRFEMADGSTVLIDEIGDLPFNLQTKILRVIEEKVVFPIGCNKPRKVDVRIISATNKNLAKMVEEGTFREDLFYRLSSLVIELPKLSERKEDIGLLVRYFIRELDKKSNRKVHITPEVIKIYESHDYHGNVRQLENFVTNSYNACNGSTINLSHLPEALSDHDDISFTNKNQNKIHTLIEYEKEHILDALIVKNWDMEQTAMLLGVQKRTLYRKITKYGLLSVKIN
jgi:PAS domain S-box-containing protein